MYKTLQVSRAAAALLVVLFHLSGTFASPKYFGATGYELPFSWGDAGVEFFFVLSGFIITLTHRRDIGHGERVLPYLRKRALRVYPTYWLVCLAVGLAALAVPSLRQAMASDIPTAVRSLLLVPQDPAVVGGTGSTILFVAWSLQYELVFYLLFALFILNRTLGLAAVALLALSGLDCLVGAQCGYARQFVASPLMLLFAFGVACACFVQSSARLPRPTAVAVAGVVGFLAIALIEIRYGRDLPIDRRLLYGFFAGVTIVGLARAEAAGQIVLRHPWATLAGDASYALYLIHIPIISVLAKVYVAMGLGGHPIALLIAFVLSVVFCLAASMVFHRYVERPMLSLFQRRRSDTAQSLVPRGARAQ